MSFDLRGGGGEGANCDGKRGKGALCIEIRGKGEGLFLVPEKRGGHSFLSWEAAALAIRRRGGEENFSSPGKASVPRPVKKRAV